MNTETRIRRLETLLDRVRARSAQRGAVSAPKPAAAAAATHAPAPATVRPLSVDMNLAPAPAPRAPEPSTPPEAGWSSPPPAIPRPPSIPVLDVVPDPFPASSAPPPPPVVQQVPQVPPAAAAPLELVESPPIEALDEEDLLEIPSDMLESVPPPFEVAPVVPSYSDEGDEPPTSSPRPIIPATSFQSSLATSDEPLLDEGREVPLKTPPPESGPQEAPQLQVSVTAYESSEDASEVDQLLEADLPPSARSSIASPFDTVEAPFRSLTAPGPTAEQLGQTIDLEEAAGPALELDAPRHPSVPPAKPEELEVPLPSPEPGGRYDDSLLPPPEAELELAAHRDRVGPVEHDERGAAGTSEDVSESTELGSPSPATLPASAASMAEAAPLASTIIERPPLSGVVAHEIKPNFAVEDRPRSFLELLDQSIALGQ